MRIVERGVESVDLLHGVGQRFALGHKLCAKVDGNDADDAECNNIQCDADVRRCHGALVAAKVGED